MTAALSPYLRPAPRTLAEARDELRSKLRRFMAPEQAAALIRQLAAIEAEIDARSQRSATP